jgi:flagellar hook protein FlgE
MNTLSVTSLSGMQAAQTALGAAAHNIANLSTAGFHRQVVTASTTAGGGVSTSLGPAPAEGAALETDVLGLLSAKNQFLANLVVFKASDQMARSLLDIQA